MSYKLVRNIGRNHSSRSSYGYGSEIQSITIHWWGSTGQKFRNVVDWLRGYTGNSGSSAHYVAQDGLVEQLVEDSRASWHGGNNEANGTSIGIEMRPEMTKGDWETLVELCVMLENRHGSLKYYRHKDWKSTACPGRYSDRIGELVAAVNAYHNTGKVPSTTGGGTKPAPSKPKPKPSKGKAPGKAKPFPWGKDHYIGPKSGPNRSHSGFYGGDDKHIKAFVDQLVDRGWNAKKGGTYLTKFGNDGQYGAELETLIRAFQKDQGLDVDGLAGKSTWDAAFKNPVT